MTLIKRLSICITFGVITSMSFAQVQTDFGRAVDPPLLKKIHMYNAGIINPHEENYNRDIDKINPLNSNTFRLDIGIGKDGTPGSNPHVVSGDLNNLQYNFSKLDKFVAMSNQHYNRPYMAWCYIPKPLQANNDWLNLNEGIPNWRDKWKEIYKQYASHYRAKAAVDPNYRIGYHEIYNEPDLEILKEWGIFPGNFRGFLELNDFKNHYNDMYKYGALGVREGDPDATVGGPAFALGEIGGDFLNFVKQQNLPMDFYSFHSYMDGNTWPNELNTVRDMLTTKGFTNAEIHITEFTWYNDAVGPNNANSPLNFYQAAPRTFDVIDEALRQTDVNIFHWAQFMESTFHDDSYGMIRKDGHLKAVYNVFKIFGDMPIDRRAINTNNNNLGAFASSDGKRACIAVWNRSGSNQNTSISFSNVPFAKGNFKLYRIDKQHGSYFDGGTENINVIDSKNDVTANGYAWSGDIPAHGVVYSYLKVQNLSLRLYQSKTSKMWRKIFVSTTTISIEVNQTMLILTVNIGLHG